MSFGGDDSCMDQSYRSEKGTQSRKEYEARVEKWKSISGLAPQRKIGEVNMEMKLELWTWAGGLCVLISE